MGLQAPAMLISFYSTQCLKAGAKVQVDVVVQGRCNQVCGCSNHRPGVSPHICVCGVVAPRSSISPQWLCCALKAAWSNAAGAAVAAQPKQLFEELHHMLCASTTLKRQTFGIYTLGQNAEAQSRLMGCFLLEVHWLACYH